MCTFYGILPTVQYWKKNERTDASTFLWTKIKKVYHQANYYIFVRRETTNDPMNKKEDFRTSLNLRLSSDVFCYAVELRRILQLSHPMG